MLGLAHIGIMVANIEASIAFYRDTLGFELTNETDMPGGTKLAFLNVGTCLLELIQPGNPGGPRPAGVVDHIAIETKDTDALVCCLKEKGVKFLGDVAFVPGLLGGVKNVFFTGPDGERLEFFEYQ